MPCGFFAVIFIFIIGRVARYIPSSDIIRTIWG